MTRGLRVIVLLVFVSFVKSLFPHSAGPGVRVSLRDLSPTPAPWHYYYRKKKRVKSSCWPLLCPVGFVVALVGHIDRPPRPCYPPRWSWRVVAPLSSFVVSIPSLSIHSRPQMPHRHAMPPSCRCLCLCLHRLLHPPAPPHRELFLYSAPSSRLYLDPVVASNRLLSL